MTDDEKPVIRLWELRTVGLIVLYPSGVRYSNQVGGYAVDHPVAEGVFVPLQHEEIDQQAMLCDHFTGPKWGGHCYGGIDDDTADFIDAVLAKSTHTACLKVNRDKLKDCEEAWIHVVITPDEMSRWLMDGFPGREGVLTWENSD